MTDDQKLSPSTVPEPPTEVDLKLKQIIRGLADEAKPEAIRILRRIIEETRANEE